MRSTVCHARSHRISIDSPRNARTVGVAISVRQRDRAVRGRHSVPGAAACASAHAARQRSGCGAVELRTPGRSTAKPERGRSDSSERLPSSRSRCWRYFRRFMPRNGCGLGSAARRAARVRVRARTAFPAAASAVRRHHKWSADRSVAPIKYADGGGSASRRSCRRESETRRRARRRCREVW
jgi:hypothetical protein